MKKKIDFWEKNFLIAINKNGKKTAIPKDYNESYHYELFTRLFKKLKIKWEIDKNRDSSNNLPNVTAEIGYLLIYPVSVYEENVYKWGHVVIFPNEPTIKQLETLEQLFGALEKLNKVFYVKRPNPFSLHGIYICEGLANLKEYFEEKIKKLNEKGQLEER